MSDLGDALQGIWTLLDMLGSFVRKLMRGKRTTIYREWRHRDNSGLGIVTLAVIVVCGFLIWAFLVM